MTSIQIHPPHSPAATLSVAVVGAGAIATRHLNALAADPRATLAGICDPREDAGRAAAGKHGCGWWPDAESVWADDAIDAVYLCLPNFLHHEMAIQAMRRGKHVFVEKPLANTPEQCAELRQVSAATGMQIVVGHQYRFLPVCRRLREWVDAGELGEVVVVVDRVVADYRVDSRQPWFLSKALAGGGALMNTGVHQIDRVCWLLDAAPRTIHARIDARFPGHDIDSHVSAHWQMPGGQAVHLLTAAYPSRPENTLEVIGTRGQVRIDFGAGTIALHRGMEPERVETLPDRTHAAGAMIDQLVHAIQTRTPAQTGAAWGEFVVRVAAAHYASADAGQPVHGPALPRS